MKRILLPFLFVGLLLTGSGCEKALELKPVSQITANSFWQTPDDFEAALVGCYDGVQVALTGTDNDNVFLWGEGRADGVTARDQVGLAANAVTGDGLYGVNWQPTYQAINNLNLLLKNLNQTSVVLSAANRARYKADAFFLRGLMYHYLGRLWGNAPVVTAGFDQYSQDLKPGNGQPNQRDLVFAQVRADADSAIRIYGQAPFTAASFTNKGRGSLAAAYALRADLNLWLGWLKGDNTLFSQAVADVDLALQNTTLYSPTLTESYKVIFGANNPKEDVFVIKYSDPTETNRMFVRATVGGVTLASLNNPYATANSLFVPGFPSIAVPSLQYIVSQKLAGKYRTGDVRRDENMVQFFPRVANPPGIQDWYPRKYRGNATAANPVGTLTPDNIRIYRAGDLVLMKAEALAKLGRSAEAIASVNLVRRRAFETAYNATVHNVQGTPAGEALVDTVLDERFRELAYEGKRWFDLARTKRALTEKRDPLPSSPTVARPVATKETDLLWPISVGALSLNSNLKQNAGY